MKLTTLVLTAAGLAVANAEFGCNVERVICGVHNYRAKYGLKPLNMDSRICRACQKHSQYMASRHSLDHTGSGGSSAGTRMRREGVSVGGWAENIASGQKTEDAVCAAWIKSAGHRRNIVGNYDAVCVARYGDYWTQDFVSYSGGYSNASPVRCSGSAPVSNYKPPTSTRPISTKPTFTRPISTKPTSTRPTSTKPTSVSPTMGYRKVLYRKLYVSDGRHYYKYYYKYEPIYTHAYHDAEGDHVKDAHYDAEPTYDLTEVQDVADEYEPEGQYETDVVEHTETKPEESHYRPKCPPKLEPTAAY